MSAPLRAGVIGAGVFGGHHARKLAAMPGVALAAIYDPDGARAEALAAETGARAEPDLAAFLAAVDVVTVTAPASLHADLTRAALTAGRPVYVEKPLATSLADGDGMVALAARQKRVLACGHQERVVFRAMGLLDLPEAPLRIDAVRHGPRSGRNEDVSAVLDLMVHDLDLALLLTRAEPFAVEAEGDADATRTEIAFADGLTAVLSADRAVAARERRMLLTFRSGEVEVDFLARTFRNTTSFALDPAFADTPDASDPLATSLRAFVAAVRGEGAPLCTGVEALAALDLALAVEQAAGF